MGNASQRGNGTNRVYRRAGSPYWQAEWYDAAGKRHQRSTRTDDRAAAIAFLRTWERAAADPSRVPANTTSVRKALEALQALRSEEAKAGRKSHATVDFVTDKSIHPMRILGADLPLTKVDAAAVDRYIAQRRGEGAADSTIHKELVVLRCACALAGRRGLWPHDIAKVFPRGFSPQYVPRTRWLPPTELERLLAALPLDRAAEVAFIVATSSEAAATRRVRPEDLDLETGRVHVRGTKRASRDRVIPVVFPWQRDLLTFAVENATPTKGGLLFRPWGNVRRDLHDACRRAGCRAAGCQAKSRQRCTSEACAAAALAPCSPNDLRRTTGHWTRGEGAQPATVGALLGHRDGRMAERVYAALQVDELAAALTREAGARTLTSVTKVSENGRIPSDNADSADSRSPLKPPGNAVPRDRIELPTRGFSVPSSIPTLRLPGSGLRLAAVGGVTKVSGGRRR